MVFRAPAEQVVALNTVPRRVTRTYRARGLTVVELHGDIDIATTDEARRDLEPVTARPAVSLLLDLRPVTFFDCAGVRLLMFAQQRTLEQRGRLYLVCDAPQILRLLDITGLRSLCHPASTVDQVLADTVVPPHPWRHGPRAL
ncbi:anti-sigma factor antagonist [Streptomyces sp. Ac-502]|uniref:anti-sigma factor antagonist n=1 Tax=Streptomyces sp. Ac-502 TaxID=3342801 RepID=UPI003862D024